jgi:pilus assembly protein CpaE
MSPIEYAIKPKGDETDSALESGHSPEMDHLRPLPRISIHAFCESDATLQMMERLAADRRMSKVSLRITNGEIEAAAAMFTSSPTPNLIILETSRVGSRLLEDLAPLAEVCDPTTRVIILGRFNDITLYRELMRNGISEYLVAPIGMSELLGSISAIFVDPEAEPLGRNIAFIGAKGGVGSSTIAHNCAFGIASLFSTETILADLDLPFGTVNIDFDQDPAQGIAEAVYAPERLDEVFAQQVFRPLVALGCAVPARQEL